MENKQYPESTTEAVLLKALEIQWDDHFQTRLQTWKPLEIEAAMALAMIGADIKVGSLYVTGLLAVLLVVVAVLGILVTNHHRGIQANKFEKITALEKKLGIFYAADKPVDITWGSRMKTPYYLLLVHIVVVILACGYFAFRVIGAAKFGS